LSLSKSIFADVHAAGKNALHFICACGRKLCVVFSLIERRIRRLFAVYAPETQR